MTRILPPHFFDSDEDYHAQFNQLNNEEEGEDFDDTLFEAGDRDCDYWRRIMRDY
ncbi:MAG: hypothetical protein SOX56_09500 [[Pasteurella] mairii]|uniref:Uncharacterized protein n=1 Tax=[Pasteurella] mairii TaxID=757 RepID=A0A379B418_9PAST|nr:hypothetical protein [[Pasteurella] mairii]SUB28768.1 Uncharacterised protein [[Pasteurella] mairii]SUB33364.1 Uncharacterised protein [[Pasteurella] mairii]